MSESEAWSRFGKFRRLVENMNCVELVRQMLQDPGFDVNYKGYEGWDLLKIALDSETLHDPGSPTFGQPPRATVSLILLVAGANPSKEHVDGLTAIEYARRKGHAELLRAVGQD